MAQSSSRSILFIAAAAFAAACGGDKGTGPRATPASVVAVTPPAGATVGTALAAVPTFEVRSAGGVALAGVSVTVVVTAGGGNITGAPTASLAGPTPIGVWTLGPAAGTQSVTVTVVGITPLTISVNAAAGAPVAMEIIEGNNQSTGPLTTVSGPIRVRVRDAFGNGVAAQIVTWTVGGGGGQLSSATSTTDAAGIATAPAWTLGSLGGGVQAIIASVGTITARFTANPTAYSIDLRFLGATPSQAVQQAFSNAVARIRSIIVGDLQDIAVADFAIPTFCLPAGSVPPLTETIDDIIIFARVDSIDGPGGVLGSAGPCIIRSASIGSLTVIGSMRFDSADLLNLATQGRLENVILHEMLHVIGIGTLWSRLGLLGDGGTTTVSFLGATARDVCANQLGGASPCAVSVPAENCLDLPPTTTCGAGTQNSHWKESIFVSELMTGYLGALTNPLSLMTIQSLFDLGYGVNTAPADAYMVPAPGLRALLAPGAVPDMRMPAPRLPRLSIDANGNTAPIPDR